MKWEYKSEIIALLPDLNDPESDYDYRAEVEEGKFIIGFENILNYYAEQDWENTFITPVYIQPSSDGGGYEVGVYLAIFRRAK